MMISTRKVSFVHRLCRTAHIVVSKAKRSQQIGLPQITRALELTNYGEWGRFEINYERKFPELAQTDQILIRNLASSINKHDSEVASGYIQTYLAYLRQARGHLSDGFELPLVLGRDFAGVVLDVGKDVTLFKPGDEVFGAATVVGPGCFSDMIVVNQKEARLKPKCLSFQEAASLPYAAGAALTVFNSLRDPNQYHKNLAGKRVLLHGAGGGVGTIALQLLKSSGAHVSTTSLARSLDLLRGLGADDLYVFRAKEFKMQIEEAPKFDVILDTTGESEDFLLPRINARGAFVSLKQRLFERFDEMDPDLLFSIHKDVWKTKARCVMRYGCNYRYFSYQEPYVWYLDHLIEFVNDGTIVPVVQEVIGLEDVPATIERLEKEHAQGKTVVDMLLTVDTPRLEGSKSEMNTALPPGDQG